MRIYRALIVNPSGRPFHVGLRELGFQVASVTDAAAGLRLAETARLDLIVLESSSANAETAASLNALKRATNAQVMVLTPPGSPEDWRLFWEAGANDCLPDTLGYQHFLARVRVRLRAMAGPLRLGGLVLDLAAHRAQCGRFPLELSPKEFLLLAEFMRAPGVFWVYSELFWRVWRRPLASSHDLKALQIQTSALRQCLQPANPGRPTINNLWDEGYRVETDLRPRPKILIIDPDQTARQTLSVQLAAGDYDLIQATTGGEALELIRAVRPDLILLEPQMTGLDGLSLCRLVRRESDVPILLTSDRPLEMDQIAGLEAGASDYLVKPVAALDLLARVRANLPAVYAYQQGVSYFRAGELVINCLALKAWSGQVELALRRKEFTLLLEFVRHAGAVLSRDELRRRLWADDPHQDEHAVEVHISLLRSKLESGRAGRRYITTVQGGGYRLGVPAP